MTIQSITYQANGGVKLYTPLDENKGYSVSLDKNGVAIEVGYYENGEKQGNNKLYDENGNILRFRYHTNYQPENQGLYSEYYKNGAINRFEFFRDNMRAAYSIHYTEYYDEKGNVRCVEGGVDFAKNRQEGVQIELVYFKNIVQYDKLKDIPARKQLNVILKAHRKSGNREKAINCARQFYATPHPVAGCYRRSALKCIQWQNENT